MTDNVHGTVAYWNERDGYGFFAVNDSRDVFFRYEDAENRNKNEIKVGDVADFRLYDTPNGRLRARLIVFK